jgi:sirohydrochlorin cobaltochelatase
MGQLAIACPTDGVFILRHYEDVSRDDLVSYDAVENAMELARFDDAGSYRPLKTAPTLRHGWQLTLADPADLRLALDHFYPGRLAAFFALESGGLGTTPLRDTLERQSGMYRIAAQIRDDQLDKLVGDFCRSDGGCLRTIRWRRDRNGTLPSTNLPPQKFEATHDQTGGERQVIPLLCQEGCSLLVSAAREIVQTDR